MCSSRNVNSEFKLGADALIYSAGAQMPERHFICSIKLFTFIRFSTSKGVAHGRKMLHLYPNIRVPRQFPHTRSRY